MTDQQTTIINPEELPIPVKGDCGHDFSVPLARLDGQEFLCPVCGATDNLDEAAVEATRKDIEKLVADGTLGNLANVVKAYLEQMPALGKGHL
jgi:hypothetical protein